MIFFQILSAVVDTVKKGLAVADTGLVVTDTAKQELAAAVDTGQSRSAPTLDVLSKAVERADLLATDWWVQPHWIAFGGSILAALIGAFVSWLVSQQALKQYQRLFEEEEQRRRKQEKEHEQRLKILKKQIDDQDERRYLEWVIKEHRFLSFAGLRMRS